jgi:uncharacterized membrane protein YphA (DoxX/SURF4 family)
VFVLYVVIAILLALAVIASGVAKLVKTPQVVEQLTGIGVPLSWFPPLATAEILGGLGLLIGIGVAALGVLAGVALALYYAGALLIHRRAQDPNITPAAVLLVLAVLAVITRAVSA